MHMKNDLVESNECSIISIALALGHFLYRLARDAQKLQSDNSAHATFLSFSSCNLF